MGSGAEFHRWAALVILLGGFASFLIFERHRHWLALGAAALTVATGLYGPIEALGRVDWRIIIVFSSTLLAAEIFMLSGAAAVAAESILVRVRNPVYAIIALLALTGFLSMFVENVACVLIAAPVALSLTKRLKMAPQPILVATALVSNLQGCALLVGDPPSMFLAQYGRFGFFDFIWYAGRPSIFFCVQAGALAGLAYLAFTLRKHHGTVHVTRHAKLLGVFPAISLAGVVAALAVDTQIEHGIGWGAAAGTLFFAAVSLAWYVLYTRRMKHKDEPLDEAIEEHALPTTGALLKSFDWRTTLFLIGIFVPVGALADYGWVDSLARGIMTLAHGSQPAAFLVLVVAAVIASALLDNVPFLLVMLPAIGALGMEMGIAGKPVLLYFGLLLGASVGGNITPIGAQANIAAVGFLRKHGAAVTFRHYLALSLPYTVVALVVSCLFAYLVFGIVPVK